MWKRQEKLPCQREEAGKIAVSEGRGRKNCRVRGKRQEKLPCQREEAGNILEIEGKSQGIFIFTECERQEIFLNRETMCQGIQYLYGEREKAGNILEIEA